MLKLLEESMCAWDWYLSNERLVRKICAFYSRGDPNTYDDVWEELVLRIPRIFELWDEAHPSGTPLNAWMAINLRWYAKKVIEKGARDKACAEQEEREAQAQEVPNLEAYRTVQHIWKHLTPEEQTVLSLRYYEGLTFADIAWHMDVYVKTAQKLHRLALERAREILDGR